MYYKILAFSPKKDHTKSQLLRSSESTYEEVSNVYTWVLESLHFTRGSKDGRRRVLVKGLVGGGGYSGSR